MTKITIERNALNKSLSHVQRVVERRNTYPVLANVLIDAGGNGITLRATDLDIEVTESVPATVASPFTTTVPAHTLSDIVKKLADGSEVTIDLKDDGAGVTLKSGRSRFNLATLDAASFPDLKSGAFPHEFQMPAADLRAIIDRTQFAISSEETRYYLNGIYIHALHAGADGTPVLRGVSTDGHRMARHEVPLPEGAMGIMGSIVPKKTVAELQKLLDGITGDVGVEMSDTKIRVTVGEVVLLSKLIEGTFPDYDRVTPKNNGKSLLVNRADFAKAVDRVSVVATDKGGKAVKLTVDQATLALEVRNADHGTATEELGANWSESSSLEIGFNARYLLDVVNQIGTDEVSFAFSDANGPALISAPSDTTTIYVLMPMRVG